MVKFIEVENSSGKRCLINVNLIEEVIEDNEENCTIYIAFCVPGAITQDAYRLNMPYDKVVSMIKE